MLQNPCYNTQTKTDCPKRCAGCATTCPEWAKYTQERNKMYEQRAAENRAKHDAGELAHERRTRLQKNIIRNRRYN